MSKKKETKKRNIDVVSEILGGQPNSFNDGSGTWILFENDKHSIHMCFDGKGDKFEGIMISEKIYKVVEEKVIVSIKNK